MSDRRQINVRADDEFLEAIEDIRSLTKPIPTVSEAIRRAVIDKAIALRRRMSIERKRNGR